MKKVMGDEAAKDPWEILKAGNPVPEGVDDSGLEDTADDIVSGKLDLTDEGVDDLIPEGDEGGGDF